ncbi:hypothetical protein Bca52824_072753 [Brassica carinata]|uniref:Uncharacterized protein n=1 Tax=Brassica carinata TaxID=52824 RepID=A0A8X7QE19_BRACI|nr:hypothetical protein Bca52824_072753 [Brassica carinata]
MTIAIASFLNQKSMVGETADSIYSETEDLIRRDQAEIRYNYVSRFSILLNPRLSLDFRRHATVVVNLF